MVMKRAMVAAQNNARGSRQVLAIGSEAKKMLRHTLGSIVAILPLRDGANVDFESADSILRRNRAPARRL